MTEGEQLGIPIQGDQHWHELRAQFGGSSEAPALFGLGYENMPSKWSIYALKTGQISEPDLDADDRVWLGKELEAVIARAVTRKHGFELRKVRHYYRHPNQDIRMGCTCDFECIEHEDGPGIIEIKNRDYLEWVTSYTDEQASIRDKIQIAHQMACRPDMAWGALGCLVGGNTLHFYRYTRADLEEIITDVEAEWIDFWRRIEEKDEPDLVAGELPEWARLHFESISKKPDTPIVIEDDDAFGQICKDYSVSSELARHHKSIADEAKAKIINLAGEATTADSTNWHVKINYSQTKATVVQLPETARELLLLLATRAHTDVRDQLKAMAAWEHTVRRAGVRVAITVEHRPPRKEDPEAAAAEKGVEDAANRFI